MFDIVGSPERDDSKSVELARTQVKSRELFYEGKMGNDFRKPTKHEEWSKSLELVRTFRSIFVGSGITAEWNRRF